MSFDEAAVERIIKLEGKVARLQLRNASLRQAIVNEGINPEYHRAVMARHREEWPRLWVAIDGILALGYGSEQ